MPRQNQPAAARNGRRHTPVPTGEEPVPQDYELVNHPAHYTPDSIECIDGLRVILTRDEFIGFLRGTIIKYQWRMGKKPGEDLLQEVQKCMWYMQRLEDEIAQPAEEVLEQ